MKNTKKATSWLLIAVMALWISSPFSSVFALTGTFTASEQVANVVVWADASQTDVTTLTTANNAGTQSITTFTVGTAWVNTDTLIIDGCTITFTDWWTADYDCTNWAWVIDSNVNNTVIKQADELEKMTFNNYINEVLTGNDTFKLTHVWTPIAWNPSFTEMWTINVTKSNNTVWEAPVAQVNTITIGWTIEVGDVFTANLPWSVVASFTATTTSANDVATWLNAAILASAWYDSQAFTSVASSDTVVLTAKVAWTWFTQTSSATNRPAVAQVVDFVPATPTDGETYRATINGTDYDYTVVWTKTIENVVDWLQLLMDANGSVTCTEDNAKVICTADVAWTSFTFGSTVVDITAPIITIVNPTTTLAQSKTITATISPTTDTLTMAVNNAWVDTCNGTLTFVSYASTTFNTEADNGKKVCYKATDTAWNIAYSLSNAIAGIDITAPTITIANPTTTLAQSKTITATISPTTDTLTMAVNNAWVNTCNGTLTFVSYASTTFNTEADNGKKVCYKATDTAWNIAYSLSNAIAGIDITAPTITQVNPISTNTTDTTPNYTFSSNEVGVITYSWACTSSTTSASIWSNTVTFSTLAAWTYSNCTIKVTDSSSNVSNIITVSPFTVITWVSNTVTLKTGWNVFSTPNTLQTIAFSNSTGFGLTFYKLEWGVYSQVTVSTSTIVPLAGFLVNNTSGAAVDVYLTAKTWLTANEKLHQKSLTAGWNILGTVTNTTPFDTIWTKATAKIDLTNWSTNPNVVHTSFVNAASYQTWEAYWIFMSEAGIYGWNENN